MNGYPRVRDEDVWVRYSQHSRASNSNPCLQGGVDQSLWHLSVDEGHVLGEQVGDNTRVCPREEVKER